MPKGIMYVATRPSSPDVEAEYHAWYESHLKDIVDIDGIVAARRFAPVGDDGPFVAIYEIDTDDIAAVRARLSEASQRGEVTTSPALQLDPTPTVLLYEQIAAYEPD